MGLMMRYGGFQSGASWCDIQPQVVPRGYAQQSRYHLLQDEQVDSDAHDTTRELFNEDSSGHARQLCRPDPQYGTALGRDPRKPRGNLLAYP